jgi:hypothetical protein
MSDEEMAARVARLEAWVEVIMRMLATLGLEALLIEHPSSEADIQRAIDDALLSETHYLDCKPGVNTGLAAVTARPLVSTRRIYRA